MELFISWQCLEVSSSPSAYCLLPFIARNGKTALQVSSRRSQAGLRCSCRSQVAPKPPQPGGVGPKTHPET